jgi:hypothetical protein
MSEMHHLDRRLLLQRALLLLGAAPIAITPAALAKTARRVGTYLDAKTFGTLSAICDTLIPRTDTPGAIDVRVPAMFDSLLVNWASDRRRHELTQAIATVDQNAIAKHGERFSELPTATREIVLKAHEADAMKILPQTGDGGIKSMLSGPAYADAGYGKLKELVVLLYYSSEPALTQELNYVHSPGEWKPSIPVTADTRPAAGGLF